ALAQDPPPERKRNLDPVLEHESRTGLEYGHRAEDQSEGDEAEPPEGPQALRARRDRSDDEGHDQTDYQDRHGHRIRGNRTIRVEKPTASRSAKGSQE